MYAQSGVSTITQNAETENGCTGLPKGDIHEMTDDEQRVQEIERRVRASICSTYDSSGNMTIEGRISKDDFEMLLSSRLAWRVIAKQKDKWQNLPSEGRNRALDEALEATTADLIQAHEEIEALTARVALYEKTFMRSTTSAALN
jgi:hypothetical protein